MDELFAILMSWAVTLSGYPRAATAPEIVMVPHSYLVAEACGGRECKVLGWYPPGQKIFLDERLDPADSLYASSIVVHEMVHFLQQQSGHFAEGFTCAAALKREREAYAVQGEFLLRSGAYQPVGASMHAVGCGHTHERDATSARPEEGNGLSSATPRKPQHQLPMSIVTLTATGVATAATAGNAAPEAHSVDRIIERAYAPSQAIEGDRGWSLAIDNDLFALTQSDRDYTGGLGVTVHGAQTAEYRWSPDPLLARIDRLTVSAAEDAATVLHAVQVGLISFTPEDLRTTVVVPEDRPYASLLFVTGARQYVADDERAIRYSELTVGALGLSLTSDLHDAVHDVVGSELPRGYDHQISAGGEATARYVTGGARLRGQRLALGSRLLETKTSWELSAGYLTEASYAFSTRLGAIHSPWWSFNPERVDYIARPSPLAGTRGANELYLWAGAKLRLRAYNAFLQGQFRDSDHTFSAGELNHVIGEAWLGVTGQFSSGTQVSYVMRYQTAEIRDGIGSRDSLWAGVTMSHGF